MLVKDKFLGKINFLILLISLCFSHKLYAENINQQIINYNKSLNNTSAHFIQTNQNNVQEGLIYFGDERIKIEYQSPEKLTIILSENKGMFTNHELKETNFFATKKSYVKFFFDILHKEKYTEKTITKKSNNEVIISDLIKLDDVVYKINIVYENEPLKLRKLEILSDDENIQMGFFNHSLEKNFEKKFFSMVDPYLN